MQKRICGAALSSPPQSSELSPRIVEVLSAGPGSVPGRRPVEEDFTMAIRIGRRLSRRKLLKTLGSTALVTGT